MGKIRTRIIGDTDVEEKQKKKARERSIEKKKEQAKAEKPVVDEKGEEVEKTETKKTEKKAKKNVAISDKKIIKQHGKSYLAAKKMVDPKKKYSLSEAATLLMSLKYAKFDESVELHLNVLEIGLRGEVSLPHGTGKKVNVVIADDSVLDELEKGKINFDILVAHPSFMSKLAKYARVLGPKGLMPNPKSGTIGPEPEKIVEKFKKGSLRWKTEPKAPLIHQMIGKVSLKEKAVAENAEAFILSVGLKNITKAYIKNSMSPALQIDLTTIA